MDYLQGPDEQTLINIKTELGEDDDRMANNLKLLETWMSCQPHMPKNYDKKILPIFLRSCKHDMEKTKKKLQKYFTLKAAMPDFFDKRDPERKDVIETLKYVDIAVMPRLTPAGYRLTICRMKTDDVAKFKIDLFMMRGSMSACIRTVYEYPTGGDVLIYDASNMTAAHAATFLTPLVKRCCVNGPEAYPNRVKQIHVVNTYPIVERIVSVVRGLFKEKIRNRFFVHSNVETLLEHVPAYCLPKDFGGSCPPLEEMSQKTYEYVRAHSDWLKSQEDVKAIGVYRDMYEIDGEYGSGAVGSFRKLALD